MSKFALAAAAVLAVVATPGAAAAPAHAYRCVDVAGRAAHYRIGPAEIRFWRAAVKRWSDNWCDERGARCAAAAGGVEARGEDWTMTFGASGALVVSTDAADEELTCTAIQGDPEPGVS